MYYAFYDSKTGKPLPPGLMRRLMLFVSYFLQVGAKTRVLLSAIIMCSDFMPLHIYIWAMFATFVLMVASSPIMLIGIVVAPFAFMFSPKSLYYKQLEVRTFNMIHLRQMYDISI